MPTYVHNLLITDTLLTDTNKVITKLHGQKMLWHKTACFQML